MRIPRIESGNGGSLAEYLEDGKRKGLQESSIHLHDKIGHYFLSALADTGCAAPQAMNAQNVGAACLMVSSKWYLSHIRTFLRYAYQARHTDRDYSGIVPLSRGRSRTLLFIQ